MKVAHLSGQPEEPVTFSDGLGVRVAALSEAGERLERFTLPEAFVPVQKAVQERVSRLQNLHHVRFARLRGFETAPRGGAPVVISSATDGRRLSDVLMFAAHGLLTVDIGPALQVTRELLAALGVLHDSRNVTHGSIAPERIVLGQNGRIVVVEHVLSQALDRLHLPRHQLWRDWRIATPPAAGPVRFDTRTDLAQTGVAVLALLLGRPIEEDEYPHRLRGLLPGVRDRLSQGGANRIARELQQWLERLLPSDGGRPFGSVKEAQLAFEALVSSPASSLGMSPARVKALLAACAAFDSGPADTAARDESDAKESRTSADAALIVSRAAHDSAPPSASQADDVDIEALLRLAAELDAASDAQLAAPGGSEATLQSQVPETVVPATLVDADSDAEPEPASSAAVPLAVGEHGVALDAIASERVSLHQRFADLLAQVAPEPTEEPRPEPTSLVQDAIRWTFEPVADHGRNAHVPWHDTPGDEVLPVESTQLQAAAEVTGVDAWLLAGPEIAASSPVDVDRAVSDTEEVLVAAVDIPEAVATIEPGPEADDVTEVAPVADAPDTLGLAGVKPTAGVPEVVDAVEADGADVAPIDLVPAVDVLDEAAPPTAVASLVDDESAPLVAPELFARVDLAADEAAIAEVAFSPDVAPADLEAVAATTFVDAAPADAFDAPDALGPAAAEPTAAAPETVDELVVDVPEVAAVIAVPDDGSVEDVASSGPAPAGVVAVVAALTPVDVESRLDDAGAPPADPVLTVPVDIAADEAVIAEVVVPADVAPADVETVAATTFVDAAPADEFDAADAPVQVAAEPIAPAAEVVDECVVDVPEVVAVIAAPDDDSVEDLVSSESAPTGVAVVAAPVDGESRLHDLGASPADPVGIAPVDIAQDEAVIADVAFSAGVAPADVEAVAATTFVGAAPADEFDAPDALTPAAAEPTAAAPETVDELVVDVVEVAAVIAVPDDDSVEDVASSEVSPSGVVVDAVATVVDVEPVAESDAQDAPALIAADPTDVANDVSGAPDVAGVEEPIACAPAIVDAAAAESLADAGPLPDDVAPLTFVDLDEPAAVTLVDAHVAADPTDVLTQDVERQDVPIAVVVAPVVSDSHEPETGQAAQTAIAGIAQERTEPELSRSAKRRRSRRKSRKPLEVADAPAAPALAPPPSPPPPAPALSLTLTPRASLIERDVPAWQPPADLRSVVADAARRAAAASVTPPPSVPPAMPAAVPPAVLALLPAQVEAAPVPAAPLALPPAVTVVADLMTAEPIREPEPRSRTIVVLTQQINWRRTAAAAVLVALLETAAFGAAWWWVQPGAKGTLVVETSVPGVEVLLDGELVGQTPFHNEVRPGRHTLTLRRGGLERSMPVEVNLGVVTTQTLPWPRPSTGALRVMSAPEGAEVVIGGKVLGRTPFTIDDLPEGRQTLVLRSPSGTVSIAATVVAGETAVVDVPIFAGWVQVHAAVELVVSIDGTRVGTNVDGQFLLAPGTHRVDVSNAALGFTASLNATVEPGKVRNVTVRLPEVPLLAPGADGAEAFVDGVSRGVLPDASITVPLGTHEVVLRSADGSERRRTLTVRAGAPVSFD